MKSHKLSLSIILLGTLVWSVIMVKSGLLYNFGVGFWGPNGHDGIWHLALSRSLSRGDFNNPVFAGEVLKNYHLGFDFILAFLSRLTSVDTSIWYFQIIPPTLALSIGLLVYKLVFAWTRSKAACFWSLFFVYFGGSIGPIIHLLRYGRLGGDSMFWVQSSATSLINPPFAMSLVFILLGLVLIQKYLKRPSFKIILLLVFLFGSLIQIKAYAGILVLGTLSVLGVWRFVKERKLDLFFLFFGCLLLSSLLHFPLNKLSGGLVVFYPFWFLETLMSFGERLFWERYYQAMINYKAAGNYLKGIPAYGVAFVIFFLGNLGSRAIGFIWFWKQIKKVRKVDYLSLFITCVILLGTIIPLFLVQKGTPWNTIQFFYYSLFFLGIISGIALDKLLSKMANSARILLVLFILGITLPTTITTLGHYLPSTPPAKISKLELEALSFLENQPEGVVLTLFLDSSQRFLLSGVEAPRPLYLYDSTAYVSAYANKPTYFDDEVNLNIMGYDWPQRKELVKSFQENPLTERSRAILRQIDPDYIYYIKNIGLKGLDENYLGIKNIFDNEEVIIYKVN